MSDYLAHASKVEELDLKTLEDVAEPVDARLSKASRPSQEQLDEGLTRQLSDFIHHGQHHLNVDDEEKRSPTEPEPIYVRAATTHLPLHATQQTNQVEFKEGDERNPLFYPNSLKWIITIVGCAFTMLACELSKLCSRSMLNVYSLATTGPSYNLGFPSMIKDLNCTEFQYGFHPLPSVFRPVLINPSIGQQ